VPVVTNSCAFYFCTRGCGCADAPGIPCALSFLEGLALENSGRVWAASRRRMREIVLDYQGIRHNEGYLVRLTP